MAEDKIKLEVFYGEPVELDYIEGFSQSAFPIKLSASSANEDLNSGVFVLQKSGSGYDPVQGDYFDRVASALDIYNVPTKENWESMQSKSGSNEFMPYYRVNEVVLFCANADQREDVKEEIISALKDLRINFYLDKNLVKNNEYEL